MQEQAVRWQLSRAPTCQQPPHTTDPAGADANDAAQFAELKTQGDLTRRAWERNVQVAAPELDVQLLKVIGSPNASASRCCWRLAHSTLLTSLALLDWVWLWFICWLWS